MDFADLSGWPDALSYAAPDGWVASDRRPYGGRSLKGLGPAEWERVLNSLLAAFGESPKLDQPVFAPLEPGLEVARVRLHFGARLGQPELIVFRFDQKIFSLRPYREDEAKWRGRPPADAQGWVKRLTKSRLVVNGGQYYPDRRSMGYLRRSGQVLEPRAHGSFQGVLAQDGPNPGIYDSERPLGASEWKDGTILQSYLVLGRREESRVRASDRLASRSLIGQDTAGRLWVVLAPGALTLADLSVLAKVLGLAPALGLDGGLETQWALAPYAAGGGGEYSHNALGNYRLKDYRPTLPSVLALEKKERRP
jgi:hypothetical protein